MKLTIKNCWSILEYRKEFHFLPFLSFEKGTLWAGFLFLLLNISKTKNTNVLLYKLSELSKRKLFFVFFDVAFVFENNEHVLYVSLFNYTFRFII